MSAHDPRIVSLGYVFIAVAPEFEMALITIDGAASIVVTPDLLVRCVCGWTAQTRLNERLKLDHDDLRAALSPQEGT